jgi:hypothetical protein
LLTIDRCKVRPKELWNCYRLWRSRRTLDGECRKKTITKSDTDVDGRATDGPIEGFVVKGQLKEVQEATTRKVIPMYGRRKRHD